MAKKKRIIKCPICGEEVIARVWNQKCCFRRSCQRQNAINHQAEIRFKKRLRRLNDKKM